MTCGGCAASVKRILESQVSEHFFYHSIYFTVIYFFCITWKVILYFTAIYFLTYVYVVLLCSLKFQRQQYT